MKFINTIRLILMPGLIWIASPLLAPNVSAQQFRGAPDQPLTLTFRSTPDSGGFREIIVAFREDGSKVARTRLYRPDAPASPEEGWRYISDRTAGLSVGVYPSNRRSHGDRPWTARRLFI